MGQDSARPAIRRSSARLLAVQALYQMEMSGASPEAVVREFEKHRLDEGQDGAEIVKPDRRHFAGLVEGVARESEDLDDMIAGALAEDWPLERLETVLRVILRAGTFELDEWRDIPARVVINEYMDIAHAFFSDKEPGLVNGVLNGLARTLRMEEFEPDASTG